MVQEAESGDSLKQGLDVRLLPSGKKWACWAALNTGGQACGHELKVPGSAWDKVSLGTRSGLGTGGEKAVTEVWSE